MNEYNSNQSLDLQSEDETSTNSYGQNGLMVQKTKISNVKQANYCNTLEVSDKNSGLPIHETDIWKEYDGVVIGSEEDIRGGLEVLGRKPVSPRELRQAIYHWRRIIHESMHTDLAY